MLKITRILALFACLTVIAQVQVFGQAHVQTSTNFINNPGGATITAVFGAVSTNTNLIVVSVTYSGVGIAVNTVTDSKGNTYAKITGPSNWNGNAWRGELWYAFNITGGAGAITVTVTLSGTPVLAGGLKFSQVYISEFSGIRSASNPLDIFAANQGSVPGPAGAAITSGSGASPTNYSNELVYASAVGSSTAENLGAGFTSASSANGNRVEFRTQVAGNTSVSGDFNQAGAGAYYANMATFRSLTSVLPIKLRSFNAAVQSDGQVRLDWVTETEINNDYFEVQRSGDGVSWETIRKVKGAGTSTATIHYTETDLSPISPVSYYRLHQVDYNKRDDYSGIQRVDIGSEEKSIRVYPNPATEWLYIDAPEAYLKEISIVNVIGVEVGSQMLDIVKRDNGISVNVSALHPGLYILRTGKNAIKFLKR
jgi:hypothetical protein